MKQYLFFLLAFIVPFLVEGQKKQHGDSIPVVRSIFIKTSPPHIENDTVWMPKGYGKVTDNMPLIDGTEDGVITGTTTVLVTQPQKDSIVKGYMFYVKHYGDNGPIKSDVVFISGKKATEHYHQVMVEEPSEWYNCEGCYEKMTSNDAIGRFHKVPRMRLYKIEVDGKAFDLSKYYLFIPEEKVVN